MFHVILQCSAAHIPKRCRKKYKCEKVKGVRNVRRQKLPEISLEKAPCAGDRETRIRIFGYDRERRNLNEK